MKSTSKMTKGFLGVLLLLTLTLALPSDAQAQAALIRFDFTGTVISTFGVPNAGSSVSGYITFDPSAPLTSSCGPHCGTYSQFAPATFFFTTNGGFTLQQTLTAINIADKFANGIVDYYVFDADVGSFSDHFSRLELTLSNNSNPFIPDISIPTTAPDFSAFQFHTVSFFGFDSSVPTQRVHAILTSLTSKAIVAIDIKPGSLPNSVNPKSKGTIPVAILSTHDFNATGEVDKTSLTFGRTGEENSLSHCTKSNEDVNGDGLMDVVCHFNIRQTSFQPGDTEGILKGKTTGGTPIEGMDLVRIVGQ